MVWVGVPMICIRAPIFTVGAPMFRAGAPMVLLLTHCPGQSAPMYNLTISFSRYRNTYFHPYELLLQSKAAPAYPVGIPGQTTGTSYKKSRRLLQKQDVHLPKQKELLWVDIEAPRIYSGERCVGIGRYPGSGMPALAGYFYYW